jgi:hypothetical protein
MISSNINIKQRYKIRGIEEGGERKVVCVRKVCKRMEENWIRTNGTDVSHNNVGKGA